MAICEIKWINKAGEMTPDSNAALYRVRSKARVEQHHGRALQFSQSAWFTCCAEHFKRLAEPGMEIWECETLLPNYPIVDRYPERVAYIKDRS
jgi:hypothetical protein